MFIYLKKLITGNWSYLIGGLLLLVLLLIEANVRGDFHIFISASHDLFDGKNIFQITYHESSHYYYSILFAIILYPFTFLPFYWANFIWLVFNVFFTYRIWKIILYFLPVFTFSVKHKTIFTFVSFFFIFSLWHRNIHLAQVTIFILYLALEGLNRIIQKKYIAGSLLIAFGLTIKLLLLPLIPYLIYRGNFRVASYICVFACLLLLIPAPIIGIDHYFFLLNERWDLLSPVNTKHVLDVSETTFHSLTTLLSVLLVEDARNISSQDFPRNIMDIGYQSLEIIIHTVRGLLILFTLYFMQSWPFKSAGSKLQIFYELSYIFLITPLIFPHQQHYAFFFVFPAISYISFYALYQMYVNPSYQIRKTKKLFYIFYFILIYFLLNSHFILGEYRYIYDHYKTLTYGVILIIPLLAICKPQQIKQDFNP